MLTIYKQVVNYSTLKIMQSKQSNNNTVRNGMRAVDIFIKI